MFSRQGKRAGSMPAQTNGESFIAGGVRIKGELDCPGEIRIDGSVEGDIRTSRITVGETAIVKGNVVAETALVEGTVTGQIRAKSVVLARTAKVTGDVFHTTLTIEPGAAVDGRYRPLEGVAPAAPERASEAAAGGAPSEPGKDPIGTGLVLRTVAGNADAKMDAEAAGPPAPGGGLEPVRFSLTGGKVAAVAAAALAVLALIGVAKPELWERPAQLVGSDAAAQETAAPLPAREAIAIAEPSAIPPETLAADIVPAAPTIVEAPAPPQAKSPPPPRHKAASDRSKTETSGPVVRPRPAAQKSAPAPAQVAHDPSRWGEGVEIKARDQRPAEAALPRESEGSFQPPVLQTRNGAN
jgi:cytoskeletal protein CcmA (bactofilin family)